MSQLRQHATSSKLDFNEKLPDLQTGFRKGRGTRGQIPNISWMKEKAREFQENIYFCLIDYDKAFDVRITKKL